MAATVIPWLKANSRGRVSQPCMVWMSERYLDVYERLKVARGVSGGCGCHLGPLDWAVPLQL